ncbi:MAG TPA: asparaginase [Burkholderiales bacterium]|nr:asparaginase [Burkholderiales bacterium]
MNSIFHPMQSTIPALRMTLALCAAVALSIVAPAPAQAQATAPAELPLVVVLSTGGTIAGRGGSTTSLTEYKSGSILGSELVDAVPEIKSYARVRVEQIANIGSTNMNPGVWLKLAARINAIFSEDPQVAGIVITHGTNTLEETAYFLNLTVKHDKPVVLVGSQRPATAISADGPLNLLNAIRVAGAAVARGKGVLVVMNEEINGARDVTKSNTYRVEAFRSGELGYLGYVDSDEVTFYRASTKRHTARSEFDVTTLSSLPKVEILYAYAEPGVDMVKALGAGGARGIVVAGTGAGGMSDPERAAIKALGPLETRPVVVRSNRTGNGRVIPRKEYDAELMVPADNLNPQKARILLMLALTRTRDLAEIRRMFREY